MLKVCYIMSMSEDQKIAFLKKMGYNPRILIGQETNLKKPRRVTYGEWRPEKEDADLLMKICNQDKNKQAKETN